MGLTLAQRQAVSRSQVRAYRRGSKAGKSAVLDAVCAVTGWHRDHARRVLRVLMAGKEKPARKKRVPVVKYSEELVGVLRVCWAALDGPAGKRLAPVLVDVVDNLRRHGEVVITDADAVVLGGMSAATIDRRLAPDRARLRLEHGRSHTKPGSLLKSQVPVRTWAGWDEGVPGFVEIDLVGHDGGDSGGEFCFTLTVTDIATGWTVCRSVKNKAQKWVFEALRYVQDRLPFPLLGIDSDNGGEFINHHLVKYCDANQITFTRSRPGTSNDGAHVEQKNWAIGRRMAGYARYDTPAELDLLNQMWALAEVTVNLFEAQQKLVSKTRDGAKVSKKHDTAATPLNRLTDFVEIVSESAISDLKTLQYNSNLAQYRRDITKIQQQLVKQAAVNNQLKRAQRLTPTRTSSDEATTPPTRTS